MIVKMKHLDLACVKAERDAAVAALRSLGAVHLDLSRASGDAVAAVKGELAETEKAVRLVMRTRAETGAGEGAKKRLSAGEIAAMGEKADAIAAECDDLAREIAKAAPYGDFDPALAKKILDAGIDISSFAELPRELPRKRLSELEADLADARAKRESVLREIASADAEVLSSRAAEISSRIAFESAKALMAEHGEVAVVSGWVPVTLVGAIEAEAKKMSWGYVLRDPADGETPPTLVEPPKFFRPMKALFSGLGIAPAYTEADVSVPFMCYFSLFFAMLVGDGAYGAIFLALTLAFRKKLPKSWFALLVTFSSATVAWGLLSNTWFGAGIPWCADWPTVKWLADPSYANMMLLCFTIGASHLILARVWNGVCRAPDSTALAEFGWAGIVLFMYFVTNAIVGIFPSIPKAMYWTFGVSLALVFLFTMKPSQLKTRGAELGMLPLNVMSALGDIISYVRLFAVGLASVKVAENFNSMATSLVDGGHSFVVTALMSVAMVAILLVGHALNIAMAALSVLVHAVRLNTLEFSNHKGVSWSGYAFNPFGKQETKERNKEQ